MMETDEELIGLSGLRNSATAKSWIDRKSAISALTSLVLKHYTVLRDAGKINICLDALLERLEDGSVKVTKIKA